MTDARTIRGMKATDLRNLCTEIVDKIQVIENAHTRIAEIKKYAEETHTAIDALDTKANLDNIIAESQSQLQEIQDFHGEVFAGDEEADEQSIKAQLDDLLKSLEKRNTKLYAMQMAMLGGVVEDEDGSDKEIPGYIKEIKEKFKGHEARYDEIYRRIEDELLSGATTIGLAKHFNAKMEEYSKARKKLEKILAILFVVGFLGLVTLAIFVPYPTDWQGWVSSLLRYTPIFSLFVWLMIWVGNRRAENHKLEESYKHKEVMAQSFTGYRKSIEEISGDDEELLKKLMHDLLDAIKQDSSVFLSVKGETHPAADVATKIIKTTQPRA